MATTTDEIASDLSILSKSRPRMTAVIGTKAAGKDELAKYLAEKYPVVSIAIGAFARRLAEEADSDEPHMRYDLSAKNLADYGAEHVMSRLIAEIMESDETEALVVTGVRTPAEAASLKLYFEDELLLVHVKVGDQETRYERVVKRSFSSDPDEYQDFVRQDEQMKADYKLAETAVMADLTLWNNGSLDAFYEQIETHIVPHLFPSNNQEGGAQ
jgi:dephospho-CoA kinase